MSDATPMSDADLRMFAQSTLYSHNPEYQDDNPYGRCALCHYTRHPCDVYDLAAAVLTLLDKIDNQEVIVLSEQGMRPEYKIVQRKPR